MKQQSQKVVTFTTATSVGSATVIRVRGGAAKAVVPILYPFEAFVRFVRFPNLMPAYSPNTLSDEQLKKIYAYIKAMPEPPKQEDIPELNLKAR